MTFTGGTFTGAGNGRVPEFEKALTQIEPRVATGARFGTGAYKGFCAAVLAPPKGGERVAVPGFPIQDLEINGYLLPDGRFLSIDKDPELAPEDWQLDSVGVGAAA